MFTFKYFFLGLAHMGFLIGLILFKLTGEPLFYLFSMLDELIFYVLVANVLIFSLCRKLNLLTFWAIMFIVSLAGHVALTSGMKLSAIDFINIRRLVLIPLCFILFSQIILKKSDIYRANTINSNLGLLVAIFGIIEVGAGFALWYFLNLPEFWKINTTDLWANIPLEEHGRFITYDLFEITGSVHRRMVSTYGEPTTLSVAFLGFIYSEYMRAKRLNFRILLFLICALLIFSKLIIIFLIIWVLLQSHTLSTLSGYYKFSLFFIIAVLYIISLKDIESGAFAHFEGLRTGIQYFFSGGVLGEGVGNAGNYVENFTGDVIGNESGIGNALGQIGILSAIYFYYFFKLFAVLKNDPHKGSAKLSMSILYALYINFLLNASSLGFGGNIVMFSLLLLHGRRLRGEYHP